ncbi:hypothetical protein FHS27_001594 [Rhodopirellula rubra]|uniref:Uncharacterized protein n=1 Tax=Aporhodopirellula rubra TaxID=980271 RepID=A0A7W5DWM4_9BACT|nr:hypothetical protein [Aporhodopirellula rubra]
MHVLPKSVWLEKRGVFEAPSRPQNRDCVFETAKLRCLQVDYTSGGWAYRGGHSGTLGLTRPVDASNDGTRDSYRFFD